MLCDLNITWSPTALDLQRTLTFLSELNYTTIALNHDLDISNKDTSNPIPTTFSFSIPRSLTILRRGTLPVSDSSLSVKLTNLSSQYDLFALRPTTEKAFNTACTSIDSSAFSLISLDLTQRFPFHFRPKPCMAAVNRGLRFELCYSQAMGGSAVSRAQVLGNIIAIVRATNGRGLIVSSGARDVLGVRPMQDVRNLLVVWGLSSQRALECLTVSPRGVVKNEAIRRNGFRGVVEIVDGTVVAAGKNAIDKGEQKLKGKEKENVKRKMMDSGSSRGDDGLPRLSKSQMKKQKLTAKGVL